MISRAPLSLEKLKLLGDKHMAHARQVVAEARRVAQESEQRRTETKRLHDRLHGPEVTLVR